MPRLESNATAIPSGVYVPNPTQIWYAGSSVEVNGTKFKFVTFTDALEESSREPIEGSIERVADHFVFISNGARFQIWYLGSIEGKRVLIKEGATGPGNLKKKIDQCQILYFKEEPNQAPLPTPVSVTPAAGAPVAPATGAAEL
jgi:hypothetical protein